MMCDIAYKFPDLSLPVAQHREMIWSKLRLQEQSLIDQWFKNTLYLADKKKDKKSEKA